MARADTSGPGRHATQRIRRNRRGNPRPFVFQGTRDECNQRYPERALDEPLEFVSLKQGQMAAAADMWGTQMSRQIFAVFHTFIKFFGNAELAGRSFQLIIHRILAILKNVPCLCHGIPVLVEEELFNANRQLPFQSRPVEETL